MAVVKQGLPVPGYYWFEPNEPSMEAQPVQVVGLRGRVVYLCGSDIELDEGEAEGMYVPLTSERCRKIGK